MTTWHARLHEQPWPHSQRLTERQIERIEDAAGTLDLNEIVEDFSDYWSQNFTTIAPSRVKTWVLALRLRTWIRNARNRQPVADRQPDERGDGWLERYQRAQRERGNG